MPEVRLCVVCPIYRATPRDVEWPQVCGPCRVHLRDDLADILTLAALAPDHVELERASSGPVVSGSKDPPAPVNLAALGINWPRYERGRRANPDLDLRDAAALADQIGIAPPVVTLDQWAGDWWTTRGCGDPVPPPDLSSIVRWLRERLDWACDYHRAVDEFAREVRHIVRALRGIIRESDTGQDVGECPTRLRDGSRCNTRLSVDPYLTDVIKCPRCARQWNRRKSEWSTFRAEQQGWEANEGQAA